LLHENVSAGDDDGPITINAIENEEVDQDYASDEFV